MAFWAGSGLDYQGYDPVGRFGYGRSWLIDSLFPGIVRYEESGLANAQELFVTVANGSRLFGGGGRQCIMLRDGTTAQLTIDFDNNSNQINFRRGDHNGTVIATWTNSLQAAAFDHFQFKVKIDNSTGYVIGRKNGSGSDNFTATGLDTQVTANAYVNDIAMTTGSIGNWCYIDDLLCFTASGDAPNDWVGDVRCFVIQGTLDTAQKDFSKLATGTTLTFGNTGNTGNRGYSANTVYPCGRITSNNGGTFTTATVEFQSAMTGNIKLALYYGDGDTQGWRTDSGDFQPGHLLAVSNQVTNPGSGANVFTFPGTVSVMKGHCYTFAILADAAPTIKDTGSTGFNRAYVVPGGYASGFPNDLAAITTASTTGNMTVYTTLTSTNAAMTSDRTPDDLTTYVYSNVVGAYDLYDLFDLPYTPTAIIGMNMSIRTQKTDSGARGAKIAALSGATAFETAEFSPLTAFSYFRSDFYELDPDTGLPWTASGINALQIGPKISS